MNTIKIITISILMFCNIYAYADSIVYAPQPIDYSNETFVIIKEHENLIFKYNLEIQKLENYLKNNNKSLIKEKITKEFRDSFLEKNGRLYVDTRDGKRNNTYDEIYEDISSRKNAIFYCKKYIQEMKNHPFKNYSGIRPSFDVSHRSFLMVN